MAINESWRKELDLQGYLVVKEIIPSLLLARMRRLLSGVERRHGKLPATLRSRVGFQEAREATPSDVLPSKRPQVATVRDVTLFGAPFEDLLFLPSLLDLVEELLGGCEFSFRYAGLGVRLSAHASSKAEAFHREADPRLATEPKGLIAILPLETMDTHNGGTRFVRDSHLISAAEAMQCSRQTSLEPREEEIVTPTVEAGSALFFGYRVIHAAGPMPNGAPPRRTILMDWLAPGVLPTTFGRGAYDGIRPRSVMSEYQNQLRMSFPTRFRELRQSRVSKSTIGRL